MSTCLVTTGATAPFPPLIRAVLKTTFLALLLKHGFSRLRVQHGSGTGAAAFADGIRASSMAHVLEVTGFEFTGDMREEMSGADLVITHAGSGSILEGLRMGKRIIAVVNDALMGNHQKELAEELDRLGYLVETTPEHIEKVLPEALSKHFNHFPPQQGQALGNVLAEEVGLQMEG